METEPLDNSIFNTPNLPARLPVATALMQRTQTTLGLLRDVVQESSAEYWYNQGMSARTINEVELAIFAFKKCLLFNPMHWKSSLHLSALLSREENELKKITALYLKSMSNNTFGYYDISLVDLDYIIKISPGSLYSYIERGLAKWYGLKDSEGAIRDFDCVIELSKFDTFILKGYSSPANVKSSYTHAAFINKGNIKYELGDYIGAIEEYQNESKSCYSRHNMALARENLGDKTAADDRMFVQENFDYQWTSYEKNEICWRRSL